MSLTLRVGDLTSHRIIEQATAFLAALVFLLGGWRRVSAMKGGSVEQLGV